MTPSRPLAAEQVKRASRALRGSIAEELTSPRPSFSRSNARLLKFHGVFQQDNRDERSRRRDEGLERRYQFTVRLRPPGGKLSAEQMLGLLDLAGAVGDGNVRITARQGMQLYAIAKTELKTTLGRIVQLHLTTLGGGGDVNCNVMCCPATQGSDGAGRALQEIAERISAALMPDDGAYNEIWNKHNRAPRQVEPLPVETARRIASDPLYGPTYLPHKFKVGIALPEDNCCDVYAQDVGLLAVCEAGQLVGFNVLVGGGMGRILSTARSFAALARPLVFVPAEEVVPLVTAVVEIFRDFGDRSDRGKARLKYLVHSWGLDRFRRAIEERIGRRLAPPRAVEVTGYEDHLGWQEQDGGRWCLGVYVDGGCIGNGEDGSLKAALREVLASVCCDIRLTPQQNLLIAGIETSRRPDVEAILASYNVPGIERLSNVRRWSMACPALPTCSAAITEAQRFVPTILSALEAELSDLGLSAERFTLRVTGCPNGCTRSYLADIAVVGRAIDVDRQVDKFAIFIGGDTLGRRLNTLYQDLVPADQVMPLLRHLLRRYKHDRHHGESLGDFFARLGVEALRSEGDSSFESI